MSTFAHWITPEHRVMVFNDPDFVPGDGAEPVNTGDWLPRLILDRLVSDTKLYIYFYDWKQVEDSIFNLSDDQVFWCEPGGAVVITVESPRYTGWGSPFKALGLEISNGPKLIKRLKEIARLTPYYTSAPVKVKTIETDEDNEKFYDGISVIRRSLAQKMGLPRSNKRGSFRSMSGDTFIKGDYIVIDNSVMTSTHGDFDIVTADVNIKSEVRTSGWTFSTANPHHAHNHAMFDVQSASWLREWLYPCKEMKDTFTTVVDTALDALRNGEWPSWMILPEQEAHDDKFTLPKVMETASEAFNRHYLRWQAYGMKPESSASIMGMAANAFKSRLESKLNFKDVKGRWKPKMWMPLPHAVYGHIMTHEVLILAGYTIPNGCEDKLFFHKESASFSLPGDQFADTFEAHGTWDLDDSAKFFIRKTKDGKVKCVIVRSPNSDGEYSIHEVGDIDGFPLYHQYGEIPEINLLKRPLRIEAVMKGQTVAGMPANTRVADPDFTEDEAKNTYTVQSQNPGVGYVANAMMVYYAALGKSPTSVLATMGDIVDVVQQTPYEAGFTAISSFTEDLWKGLANYGKVDSYLARTRVPPMAAKELTKYDGYFTRLFSHFQKEVKRYSEESRAIAFRTRAVNTIPEVMAMEFAPDVMEEAGRWVNKAEARFGAIMEKHGGNSISAKRTRTSLNRNLVRQMVYSLANMEDEKANELVLAMYRFCVIPGTSPNQRYGVPDRALFAPADPLEITVMEFFIRALINVGAAMEPIITE